MTAKSTSPEPKRVGPPVVGRPPENPTPEERRAFSRGFAAKMREQRAAAEGKTPPQPEQPPQ